MSNYAIINNKRGTMTTQTKMKDILYGYMYNCVHCGVVNAYGLTEQEADEYIKDWEQDNADLVADGETGEGACDWNYDVIAREDRRHIEDKQKCWKCNKLEKTT